VNNNIGAPKRNIAGPNGGISCLFPGDTLFIRQGTYNETITPPGGSWMRNGTGDNSRITIAGYPGETVILQPFSGGAVLSLQQTGNFSWMTFQDLIFDGTNTSGVASIAGDTHHLRFLRCELRNASQGGNSAHGFGGSGGANHEFLYLYIHHNTGYGAYFSGANSVWDHVTITDNGGYGLHFYDKSSHIDNTVVKNSIIARNGFNNSSGGGGIVLFHGDNQQVYNNLIYGNFDGVGIRSSCGDCKVYNNTIHGNQFRAIQILGENFDYEYPPGSGQFRPIREPANVVLQNNILSNNGNTIEHENGTIAAMDHNLCIGTSQNLCDMVGNPAYEDAGSDNFKLTGNSQARNRVPTSAGACKIAIDFEGTARPQTPVGGSATPCDIGAYEYNEGNPTTPPNGNPIYVRGSVGNDANDCFAAESPVTAKQHLLGPQGALSCMQTPGKVLYIEGNGQVYSEEIDIATTGLVGGDGPSFTSATRLEGYGSPLPVLKAPAGGNLNLYVRGSNAKYLIFKKLIIDGNNDTYNTVAIATPAHHIRFEEVEVKNTLGRGFEGVHISNVTNIELVDTFIHDVQTEAITLEGSIDGMLCQRCHLFSAQGKGFLVVNNGTKANVTLRETEIRNNSDEGIDVATGTGVLLQNLLLHSNGGRGVWIQSGATGTSVLNTTVYGNTGVGVQCDPPAANTQIVNNIVYGNTGGNIVNNCSAAASSNVTINPNFRGPPGDLKLNEPSPAIDQGQTLPSILTDYEGQPRQQGQQDVGAYETIATTGTPGETVTEQPCNLLAASMYF